MAKHSVFSIDGHGNDSKNENHKVIIRIKLANAIAARLDIVVFR